MWTLWEIVRALPLMLFIEYRLRVGDLPTTCRQLRLALDLTSGAPAATDPVLLPREVRHALRGSLWLLGHWPAGDSCLRRSLLLGSRLRRLKPVLRIGVARGTDAAFTAHAWLEIGGHTVDPTAVRFATLGSSRSAA